MFVKVFSSAVYGIEAKLITIEVNISQGIKYYIVGLPDVAVKESLQRIECAVTACGWRMPRQRIVVNLAPAYIRKEGSAFDLAIAIGILSASQQIHFPQLDDFLFLGELSLDGSLLPIHGVLSMVLCAQKEGLSAVLVPKANYAEASIVEGISVYTADNLQEVVALCMLGELSSESIPVNVEPISSQADPTESLDFADVKGQEQGKRALEIVASGGHNLLMIGPPGAGKSLLARLIPTIMPPISRAEALETTQIYSVTGKLLPGQSILENRPFREPHHSITQAALLGGGNFPQPGEISLAHHGVLFLDELPEFKRNVLEVLRQPLESRNITITRAHISANFPANFILVAAMNPCPCGYYNQPDSVRICNCSSWNVQKYRQRVSGPLLDRIDMHLEVEVVRFSDLQSSQPKENSLTVRQRVTAARKIQENRFENTRPRIYCNAQMSPKQVKQFCALTPLALSLLGQVMDRLGLSVRAYDRIIKVSRTLADLSASPDIQEEHVAEAIRYRNLEV